MNLTFCHPTVEREKWEGCSSGHRLSDGRWCLWSKRTQVILLFRCE